MKIEREFFYPNLAGYLGSSAHNVEEMQKKVDVFTPLYKVNKIVKEENPSVANQDMQDRPKFYAFFIWMGSYLVFHKFARSTYFKKMYVTNNF